MRPHLGTSKLEYSHQQRLAQCLPARLRAEAIHSGFYTTSNVGLQRKLGFGEVWSSMEDYPNSSRLAGKEPSGARKRAKSRLRLALRAAFALRRTRARPPFLCRACIGF